MSQLQDLTRRLLAVGGAADLEGKGEYLLYIDRERYFLNCKHWTGDFCDRQELVASSVRPNSTAACLITRTEKLIICISPSSNLGAYTYDNDEREWVESDDHPITAHKVHPLGKLAASIGANGGIHVYFQDPWQRLIYLDKQTPTVLPANPVVGSPFSTSVVGDELHLYYISSNDNYIHDVTRKNGTWRDTIVIKYPFKTHTRAFFMIKNESGDDESYVLTEETALLKFTAEGQMSKLGTVKNGKFISERSVDGCTNDAWNGTLTEDRLKSYLANDPSSLNASGGDQSMTPLAAAVVRGHLAVVRLLLRYNANPNALSPKKRTPLFYATSTSQAGDRCAVVRALLEAGANVDECYAENGFNTPLMNAITLISDQDVVNELLKHGASSSAKDILGHSVEMLAKGRPMEQVLSEGVKQPNSSEFEKQMIDFVVALLLFIIAYTNSDNVKEFVNEIMSKLQEIEASKTECTTFLPTHDPPDTNLLVECPGHPSADSSHPALKSVDHCQ